ncbi:T-cell-specific guanine nucleotide triphosphate-binding protein 2-like [Scyliorhinus canicula]|uniref:T-cell-specific guanine nucleotide triphosphate-binding protein 2-like n=1 Tax=Scyliorhinus canicula TaxID=7830 RepID=UPI0018F6BE53|nr:T-cell-specific guanine nucleotide triphosphate-binding protein 2-like [Scyliorhinus canicula]
MFKKATHNPREREKTGGGMAELRPLIMPEQRTLNMAGGPEERNVTGGSAVNGRDQMAQSTLSKFFCTQDCRNLQSLCNTGELETMILQVKRKSDHLDNVQLNIAVMGDVGSGKSTFINAMRDLRSNDQGAAPTGNEETWIEPTRYPYRALPNVQLWDFPGTNSFGFELINYLKQVKFESFDFFIIMSQARFRENDAEIAKKIQEQGKEFYYIRSKIDNDTRSLKMQGADLNEGLSSIRRDCIINFQSVGVTPPKLFLISNFEREKYDFPEIKSTLARDLPNIKSNVFSLSIPKMMLEITEPKRSTLMTRVLLLAILSGTVGVVPVLAPFSEPMLVPVWYLFTTIVITVSGWIYLRKQLGLSDRLVQSLANNVTKLSSVLKAEMKHQCPSKISPAVTNVLFGITAVTCMITGIKHGFSPMAFSIFGAVSSFAFTYKFLKDSLNDRLETGQRLVQAALSRD